MSRHGTEKLASVPVCGPEVVSGDDLLLHRIKKRMERGQWELLERELY